jgi:hypothetical protein
MKNCRSTGFSLIFKSKIYVFGGYTGDKKRSKSIESYDSKKDYWEELNVFAIHNLGKITPRIGSWHIIFNKA